jgi:hypothetical protein
MNINGQKLTRHQRGQTYAEIDAGAWREASDEAVCYNAITGDVKAAAKEVRLAIAGIIKAANVNPDEFFELLKSPR